MMHSLEQKPRRLSTDYVDVYFNHAVNDVDRLKNPEWREFTARAKQQGKIRFVGMSGHAGRLLECLDYALDTDGVDVILVATTSARTPPSTSNSRARSTSSRASRSCHACCRKRRPRASA